MDMKQNNIIKLVALSGGTSKTGKKYYRATFKRRLSDGTPITREYFLPEEVGDYCKSHELIEDVDVIVEAGMDGLLRLAITNILPADEAVEEAEDKDLF
ncbi:hypothetical protein H6A64_14400 [Lacrimispora saccharolytica]|nr:hypothetical protein [Lacrimispora saccharolytica]